MRVGMKRGGHSRRLIRAHHIRGEGNDDGCGRSLLIADGDEQSGIASVLTRGKPLFTHLVLEFGEFNALKIV